MRSIFHVYPLPQCTFRSKANVSWTRFLRATIALCPLLFAGIPCATANAHLAALQYISNHAYVNYTADHVPCSSGVVEDVTGTTFTEGGHVFDLYGNELVFRTTDSTIADVHGLTVRFVYSAPGP